MIKSCIVQRRDAVVTYGEDAVATYGEDAVATYGEDAVATYGEDAVATYGGTPSLLQPFFILFLQRADIRLQLFHDIARDDGAIRM